MHTKKRLNLYICSNQKLTNKFRLLVKISLTGIRLNIIENKLKLTIQMFYLCRDHFCLNSLYLNKKLYNIWMSYCYTQWLINFLPFSDEKQISITDTDRDNFHFFSLSQVANKGTFQIVIGKDCLYMFSPSVHLKYHGYSWYNAFSAINLQ